MMPKMKKATELEVDEWVPIVTEYTNDVRASLHGHHFEPKVMMYASNRDVRRKKIGIVLRRKM